MNIATQSDAGQNSQLGARVETINVVGWISFRKP